MTIVYLGIGAVMLFAIAVPVVGIFLMGKPRQKANPFEIVPTQRRMPYDSGRVDYRRS